MSARSPRGSLSGSSDIATDFEESLKDLQQNNRIEIMNLTTIARESTEHAQAISRVLENHIRTTAPSRKLPALYVLDSIVKNVGTPYTVYLGRNLYSTFMDAYTLVDGITRRNMDNLLKTWKEPVPGSVDPRPVFPPETVRPIENALIKAKTAALQTQRHVLPQPVYRNTPTPPLYNGHFAPPLTGQNIQNHGLGSQQPTPQQSQTQPVYPPPASTQPYFSASPNPQQQPLVDYQSLRNDISSLATKLQAQFAANPYDQATRTKLDALLQLQKLVNAGDIPSSALQSVRDQVSSVAATLGSQTTPAPHTSLSLPQWHSSSAIPQWQNHVPVSHSLQHPLTVGTYAQQPTQHGQTSAAFLAPEALSNLQALLANGHKPSTPQMRTAVPALQNASHAQLNQVQSSVTSAPPTNTSDLLAALAKSGVLSNLPSASTASSSILASIPPTQPPSTVDLLKSLQSVLPPASKTGTPAMTAAPLQRRNLRIPITSVALKVFHPELVRSLYDDQPNQCSNCGRRFLATDEGRAMKERHLDWHFRTNQRMSDANLARSQHRNWFVDEMEWIRTTEFDPSTTTAADAAAAAASRAKKQKGPQDQFVKAPPGMTTNTCSICQEEMRSSYSEELQDWVFANAVMYNGKICHATCVDEIVKATFPALGSAMAAALSGANEPTGSPRQRSATPDSSLGKRKAENILANLGARLKTG